MKPEHLHRSKLEMRGGQAGPELRRNTTAVEEVARPERRQDTTAVEEVGLLQLAVGTQLFTEIFKFS